MKNAVYLFKSIVYICLFSEKIGCAFTWPSYFEKRKSERERSKICAVMTRIATPSKCRGVLFHLETLSL